MYTCSIWSIVDVDVSVNRGHIAQNIMHCDYIFIPLFCISFIILTTCHRNCDMMNSEGFVKKSTLMIYCLASGRILTHFDRK